MNLNMVLYMRKLDKLKEAKMLYCFTKGKKLSEVFEMDPQIFQEAGKHQLLHSVRKESRYLKSVFGKGQNTGRYKRKNKLFSITVVIIFSQRDYD